MYSAQKSYNDLREVARLRRNAYIDAIAGLVVGLMWCLGAAYVALFAPDLHRDLARAPLGALGLVLFFLSGGLGILLAVRQLRRLNNQQ